MMAWLTHLQHIRDKNVIFVGILDEYTDDYGRKQYALQIEGSKTGKELPGIVDEVLTMAVLGGENGSFRAFVCDALIRSRLLFFSTIALSTACDIKIGRAHV